MKKAAKDMPSAAFKQYRAGGLNPRPRCLVAWLYVLSCLIWLSLFESGGDALGKIPAQLYSHPIRNPNVLDLYGLFQKLLHTQFIH